MVYCHLWYICYILLFLHGVLSFMVYIVIPPWCIVIYGIYCHSSMVYCHLWYILLFLHGVLLFVHGVLLFLHDVLSFMVYLLYIVIPP